MSRVLQRVAKSRRKEHWSRSRWLHGCVLPFNLGVPIRRRKCGCCMRARCGSAAQRRCDLTLACLLCPHRLARKQRPWVISHADSLVVALFFLSILYYTHQTLVRPNTAPIIFSHSLCLRATPTTPAASRGDFHSFPLRIPRAPQRRLTNSAVSRAESQTLVFAVSG